MSPQFNPDSYQEIRQIIMDAIEPLKDQLDRIYESLKNDYARKDVIDPQIQDLREAMKEVKNQAFSAPQRYLVFICTAAGLILTIINIVSNLPK